MTETDDDTQDGGSGGAPSRWDGLTRSRRQKVIGGVCGGLGRAFGIDPVIFRVVLAVLALTGGLGLVAYGIGWLLIPMEGEDETEGRRLLSGRIEGTALTAVLFALVGSGLFLSTIDNSNNQAFSLCLVGVAVGAVYWSRQRRRGAAEGEAFAAASGTGGGGPMTDAPPAAQPPPAGTPSWWREPLAKTGAPSSGYLWGPDEGAEGAPSGGSGDSGPYDAYGRHGQYGPYGPYGKHGPYGPYGPYGPHGPYGRRPRDRSRDRRERSLFGLGTFTLAVIAAVVGVSATRHHHPFGTILEIALLSALGVLALGLVIGSFLGRRGGGTLFLALVTAVLLAGASALPKSVGTDWHHTTWQPASAAQVLPTYSVGSGEGDLDLTKVDPKGATVTTSAQVGAGQLQVRVPEAATVKITAQVGLGDLKLPDEINHQVHLSTGQERSVTLQPVGGVKSSGTIDLRVEVGVGRLEVLRGSAA